MDRAFFVNDGDTAVTPYNISVGDQLVWFDAMKPSLCDSPQACREYFAQALFVVGEFGWNDYGFMLLARKSVDEARPHVPEVVGTICAATEVRDRIKQGVRDRSKTVRLIHGCVRRDCSSQAARRWLCRG